MRILTADQVRRLLAVIPPRSAFGYRDRAMLILALHTGLRVSELSGLTVAHVSHQGQAKQWLSVDRELGKGRQERRVPLNEWAQKAVLAILAFNAKRGFSVEPSAPLLVNRRHEHLNIRAIQRIVQQYREMAGLEIAATPHSFRHTYATGYVEKSNTADAQDVLGHYVASGLSWRDCRLASTKRGPICEDAAPSPGYGELFKAPPGMQGYSGFGRRSRPIRIAKLRAS